MLRPSRPPETAATQQEVQGHSYRSDANYFGSGTSVYVVTEAVWRTVFDASNKPLDWGFMLAGVPFLTAAIVMWLFRRHPAMGRRGGAVFPLFVGGFSLLWTILVSAWLMTGYLAAQSALREGTAKVVEGPVENFHAMPFTAHDTERFDVGGVHFEYGDYGITPGFNNSSSHGGPVRADEYAHPLHRRAERAGHRTARDS
jgi:hypothetical protein